MLIVSTSGESFVVDPSAVKGFIDTVFSSDGQLGMSGWAIDFTTMRPVDLVVGFVGDQMVAAAEPSLLRSALAEEMENEAVLRSGFLLLIPRSMLPVDLDGLRLYGLSGNQATELTIIESARESLEEYTTQR